MSVTSMILALVLLMGFVSVNPAPAMATGSGAISLGDAASFAVLGATTVTDTNSSTIDGSVGVSPGTAVVEGAPLMVVTNGLIHRADSVAAAAKLSAQDAYTAAGSRASTQVIDADLSIAGLGGGNTLAPGVYTSASSLGLTGTLILDGQNDPNAVFIFRAVSTLTTATGSAIQLRNGAQAANVFWQIGSSATLGTHSTFIGTIVAQASVTSTTAVAVNGRLLALTGAVTMDGGTVTVPTAVTAAAVPGAPTGVRATAGNAAATVAWATSGGGGGAAATTRYTVVSSGGQSVVVSGASATSATVTGLTNGTSYTFTVTATNWAGDSLASPASTAVTPTLATGPAAVDLKSAATFSAVALTYITLATTSTVSGDAAAGGAITKGNSSAVRGNTHKLPSAIADQAIRDVVTAYDDAMGRIASPISGVLDGKTFTAGVYHSAAAFSLAAGGKLTLDGEGNSNAVFILQTDGAIVTGASSEIILANGASASNVFWQTGGHITFGASAIFSGTLLAGSYISFGAGAQLAGRALSHLGYVSMDAASINTPAPTIVPGAPQHTSATSGNGHAVVSWAAPASIGSSAITGYTVRSSPPGFAAFVDGQARSATVSGLTNGTAYTFTVVASNGAGDSIGSTASTAVTARSVPLPPSNVSASAGNAEVTLTWVAPANTGGSPIVDYTVTSSGGQTVTVTGTTATVTGLSNGTAYTFTVTATNAAGASLVSAASMAVSPAAVAEAPGLVTALAGNAQATVSWTAPVSNGGSPITGFTVTSSPGGFAAFAGGATASATVTGLTNGIAYTFTVTATNAVGTSAASVASTSVTPVTAPRATVDVPPSIAAGSPPSGSVATQYSSFSVPTSGFPSPTFAVTAGALPVGLVLSTSTGRITGTPTTAGRSTFTITASNGVGTPAAATYTITVFAPALSLELKFLPGSNIRDALAMATASGLKVGSEFSIVMRSTPVIVHSGTVGSTGTANWRGSLPTGIPAGAHSLTLHGVAPDGVALSAVAWFSYNASGEIVATSQIGPVPEPVLGSMPDPVSADVPFLQDPIRVGFFSPTTLTESSTGGTLPTYPFTGWTDGGGTRDSGAVELWMYPGPLTLLFALTLLGAGWWWLIAARRRRTSEEEREEPLVGALAWA